MYIIADKREIRIDGKKIDNYYFTDFRLVQELNKPNEFRFLMYKDTLVEDENDISFSLSKELLGKKVDFFLLTKRSAKDSGPYEDIMEFSGIIFSAKSIQKDTKAQKVFEVIAYSPDYLLLDSPNCCSYENENLKNIVTETLKPYRIPVNINPRMGDDIPYTVQYNETSYAFLNRLASRFGEWFYYDGQELVFGKIKKLKSIELCPFYDIISYSYSLQMGHQNFSHAHHNYLDYGNIKENAVSFTEQSLHDLTDVVYEQSKSVYKKETFQNLHRSFPETGFDEMEHSIKAKGLGKKTQLMICEGSTNRADLRIGSIIKIKETYENRKGKTSSCHHEELLIIKVIHTADNSGFYENEFLAIPADCEFPPYIICGAFPKAKTQRAVVVDNNDPEKLGRVRVQFLWQKEQDENLMTPWIRISQPHGGNNKGFYFIPEIEEEVMVGFENGNAEKPYIIGTLYQGQQRPNGKWANETNDIKAIRTRNGHTVEIHDVAEGGFIRIYDNEKDNYVLTFSTDEKLIKLQSTGNIELFAKKNVIIDAEEDIIINAGKNITETAGENINETAGTDISTKAGSNIMIKAEKDITTKAGSNISDTAENNITIKAENDMSTTVGNNDKLKIEKNQTIVISGDKTETISEKYQLIAQNIHNEANDKMNIYSKTLDQRAEKEMKLDGSKILDLHASKIKIN